MNERDIIMINNRMQGMVVEQETYFFTYTFPIYRSLAVIVLYVGLLGADEMLFNYYNVNYQRFLLIDFTIKPIRVLRKVLIFLSIFFIFFLWYQLEIDLFKDSETVGKVISVIEKEYLGVALWTLCITYFIFVGK